MAITRHHHHHTDMPYVSMIDCWKPRQCRLDNFLSQWSPWFPVFINQLVGCSVSSGSRWRHSDTPHRVYGVIYSVHRSSLSQVFMTYEPVYVLVRMRRLKCSTARPHSNLWLYAQVQAWDKRLSLVQAVWCYH